MKWLYRAVALLVLLRIESTLTEIVQKLAVLRELALHPLVKSPPDEFHMNTIAVLPSDYQQWQKDQLVSRFGGTLKQPSQSFNASPGATDPGPGTTGPTAATGRSDRASGVTGEGVDSRLIQKMRPEYSRTSWLTPATEPEVGSPGPAPGNSATGPERDRRARQCCETYTGTEHLAQCPVAWPTPEHDHDNRLACSEGCPAYFRMQREKIAASGHAVICIPSLAYPHNDCDLHPHVAGEAL